MRLCACEICKSLNHPINLWEGTLLFVWIRTNSICVEMENYTIFSWHRHKCGKMCPNLLLNGHLISSSNIFGNSTHKENLPTSQQRAGMYWYEIQCEILDTSIIILCYSNFYISLPVPVNKFDWIGALICASIHPKGLHQVRQKSSTLDMESSFQ